MSVRILTGSALDVLRTLPSESVQLVVTSPPYYSLRAYNTAPQVWGGDPEHGHSFGSPLPGRQRDTQHIADSPTSLRGAGQKASSENHGYPASGAFCPCGAWRGELGSEPQPGLFVEHLLSIFDEVWRVLRKDGLVFCNLGDSYSGSGKGPSGHNGIGDQEQRQGFNGRNAGFNERWGGSPGQRKQELSQLAGKRSTVAGIPAKNLLLVPQRFAIGMQERGWIVRSEIAWCKTSAMPESVRDRPTSAWEPIWMFAKSAKYFYDSTAVRQPNTAGTLERHSGPPEQPWTAYRTAGTIPPGHPAAAHPDKHHNGSINRNGGASGASLRNFWLLGPEPSNLNHYASYPTTLVKRCILAGTSERGACSVCGSPWVRMVERQRGPITDHFNPKNQAKLEMGLHSAKTGLAQPGWRKEPLASGQTTGWQPGCSHYDALYRLMPQARRARRRQQQDRSGLWWRRVRKRPGGADWPTVPCAVLDPFLGSGTTALVADRLGRDAIGIELSEEYAEMARRRIANDAGPMFDDVTVEAPRQASLFDEVAG